MCESVYYTVLSNSLSYVFELHLVFLELCFNSLAASTARSHLEVW